MSGPEIASPGPERAPATPGKVSPESILAAPRRPVTRYRPAVIAAGVGGVILLVGLGFIIAFGDDHKRPKVAQADDPPAQLSDPASKADPRPPVRYDDLRPPGAGPGTSQMPAPGQAPGPLAAPSPAPAPIPISQDAQQSRQERTAAQASGPFFQAVSSGEHAGAAESPPAGLASLGGAPGQSAPAPTTPALSAKEQFIAQAAGASETVSALPRPPLSPYEVKAGTLISAALVTGLNSDLPGPVIAQVTEPVFDHRTGRLLLIPQGARLIGKYDSQVGYGQSRALVVWTRLIFPNGRSLNLGAMTGADATGAGGLADRVDAHLPILARAIGLSTLISIGGAAAQNSLARGNDNLVLQDGAGGLAASANQTGQRLVERDLQRAPTLMVRPGYPLRVLVDKDLIIPPQGDGQ